jgi:deaminated glutathione amidase
VRAAAIQLNASDDVERNLETADRLVRRAAGLGAELIVLPETWTVMGASEQMVAGAQTLDGPAISWARETAAGLGIDLIAGSLSERRDGEPLLSNTSVHVDRSGEIAAIYRKIHLFDVEIDGGVYGEASTYAPGSEIVTTALADGTRAGLSICFDLRYPELYRILALRGAELITVPSAFTLRTTRDHWEVLLRARAIENQCFVIAPNQIGDHPGGLRSGGRSLIVDPWGVVLAGASDGEGVIVAELDFDVLRRVRDQLPTLTRREPAAYDWAAAAPAASPGSAR